MNTQLLELIRAAMAEDRGVDRRSVAATPQCRAPPLTLIKPYHWFTIDFINQLHTSKSIFFMLHQ